MFYDSEQRNHDVHTLSTGHFISIGFVSILIVSVIMGTILEVIRRSRESARLRSSVVEEPPRRRPSCLEKYFSAFGIIENTSKLLFARSKDGDKNLEILNGIRVLSMLWVILGHTYFYMMQGALANPLFPLDLFKMFSFNLVSSGPYAVDIFFWLSGFLGVYIILCSMKKRNGKMQNPLMIYLHRYLRLIPLYVLTLLFYWFLMSSVGNGPIFFMYDEIESSSCSSTWWIHFLFLNNITEIHKNANGCMGWTWYLPNDMQFFLLIPIIVFLLYHKRVAGILFLAGYQIACYIFTIVVAIQFDLSPSYFEATDSYYKLYYHRPFARIAPFTIGVLVALLLYSFHNETPEASVFKRVMDKVHSSRLVRVAMYVVGSALFLLMIFIFYPINNYPEDFSRAFNIAFLTFSRSLLILGMSLVLLPTLIGHNRPLWWLLSLDVFTPLARLTFGAYMVHPALMIFDSYNTVRGEYVTINGGIMKFIMWVVVSFAISLI
mmetsp:Transcript_7217/g.8192  ORF Transcript_7217/g.8192 Transcript_7217/m.8192 type:complete len:491 (+) Transcript_7217:507-1979(+)